MGSVAGPLALVALGGCLVLTAACEDDRRRSGEGGGDSGASGFVTSGGETVPGTGGAGSAETSGGGTESGPDGATTTTMGSSGSSSMSTSSGGHLPECLAWAQHLCAICNSLCDTASRAWESSVATCDSWYERCPGRIDCQAMAPSCTAADECPGC